MFLENKASYFFSLLALLSSTGLQVNMKCCKFTILDLLYNMCTRLFVLECVHFKGVTLAGQLSSSCWQEKSTEDLTLSWDTFPGGREEESAKDAKPEWRQSVSS